MSTPTKSSASAANLDHGHAHGQVPARRLSTETKSSFKTTELIVFVVVAIATLIASAVVDGTNGHGGFGAQHAWLYVVLLTIGYMVSRGLAKSGSRDHYDA